MNAPSTTGKVWPDNRKSGGKSPFLVGRFWVLLLICLGGFPIDCGAEDPPKVSKAFPSGGPLGRKTSATLSGTFPKWPLQVWCSDPSVSIAFGTKSGEVSVEVSSKAEPGIRWFRLYSDQGATALIPWMVGNLDEVNEAEPNDEVTQPQSIGSLPTVVNGVLEKTGDVDTFAVELKRGECLTAMVQANEGLKFPLDAGLQVMGPTGAMLAQNLDHYGLDPFLSYQATRDGVYRVRVFGFPETPDSSIQFAGKENYVYRLTLTKGPYLVSAMPLATRSHDVTIVRGTGVSFPPTLEKSFEVPEVENKSNYRMLWFEGVAGMVRLPTVEAPLVLDASDNDRNAPQVVSPPVCISGTFEKPKDIDAYRMQVEKDSRWSIRLESRKIGSASDPLLEITDASGASIATADDAKDQADPSLEWKCPKTGDYVVSVRDLYGAGGDHFFYRLLIEPDAPRWKLTTPKELIQGTAGEEWKLEVSVQRLAGFDQDLSIELKGLPPEASCDSVVSSGKGDTAKQVVLKGKVPQAFQGPVSLTGTVVSDPKQKESGTASDTNQPFLWLSIVPPASK